MQVAPTMSDLVRLLADSLEEMRSDIAPQMEEIESAAFLIYRAMTNRSRHYHDLSHLFDVAQDIPAVAKIAAIYHDVVYLSVDGGFPQGVNERIGDVVRCEEDRIFITDSPDEMVSDLGTIFGFTRGQELKQDGGLNEFLCAILAVRELGKFLSVKDLWSVAACIEATIPFRPAVDGITPDDLLGQRLRGLRRGTLALTEKEIDDIQILAVRISIADVQNFGNPDLSNFIEKTWQILTETNEDFHSAGAYTLRTYREALLRMNTFLSQLDSGVIWRRHDSTPDDESYGVLLDCSQKNLRGSLAYLKAHIAALSVVGALADLTGGDGPISYFLGASNSEFFQISTQRFRDDTVLAALTCRRAAVQRFDSVLSPLAAYFYERLGSDKIVELVDRAREVDAGKQDWKWVLEILPKEVLKEVAMAISQNAVMRKERLDEWIRL